MKVPDNFETRLQLAALGVTSDLPVPIPMVLHCPSCRFQHVDDETFPDIHRSHLCRACLTIWRPADVPTIGVRTIETRGKADTWPSQKLENH